MSGSENEGATSTRWGGRLIPVGLVLILIAAFFIFDADRFLSYEALCRNHEALESFTRQNFGQAAAIYILIYIAVVAASVPGATVLTVGAGFLFGSLVATGLTLIGATVGATLIFLIARTALGDVLRRRGGGRVDMLLSGFRENAFSYLLFLRLVPLFPFFVVNIAPAFAAVPLRIYVVTTLLGILPGTFVYAQVGTGLGSVFGDCGGFALGDVLTPEILIALVGLGALSLIPVVVKRFRRRQFPRDIR